MPKRRRGPERGARRLVTGKSSLGLGSSREIKWGIKVKGVTSLIRRYKLIPKIVGFATLDAVNNILVKVEEEAKKLIMEGYYRPAYETGKLYNSITGKITYFDLNRVQGEVGTDVYYSIYVHEGTYFMEERQFLIDALENKRKFAINHIKKAIKRDLRMF